MEKGRPKEAEMITFIFSVILTYFIWKWIYKFCHKKGWIEDDEVPARWR